MCRYHFEGAEVGICGVCIVEYRYECYVKVCQMLSWWTKYSLYSINIGDTVSKVIPLCSVYQAPSYGPKLTLLAWFLPEFAYLSMISILEMACTACSGGHLKYK